MITQKEFKENNAEFFSSAQIIPFSNAHVFVNQLAKFYRVFQIYCHIFLIDMLSNL